MKNRDKYKPIISNCNTPFAVFSVIAKRYYCRINVATILCWSYNNFP